MKLLCVWLPNFPLAVEVQRRPELRGRAVVVGEPPLAISAACRRLGVRPGMTRRQVEHACPETLFLPADEAAYRQVFGQVLAVLDDFSPAVEVGGADLAYLDARGLERLFGPDQALARRVMAAVQARTGFRPRLGMGPGKLVAWIAARLAPPGQPLLVPFAEAQRFLADLPVELLPLEAEARERLELLGVRRIGQFLRLPASELVEQFGPAALAAYRAAAGQGEERVVPRWVEKRLVAERELEGELATVEHLRLVAAPLVETLAQRLRERYLTCRVVGLRLEFSSVGATRWVAQADPTQSWRETQRLPQPSAAPATLLEAVLTLARRYTASRQASDERTPTALAVELEDLGAESASQPGLFEAQRYRREHARRAVQAISRREGHIRWAAG